MKRKTVKFSKKGNLVAHKLDPGVFIVEIPEAGLKISLGQPPDAVKRFQQVGYFGSNAIDMFVIADSKMQDDSISWRLIEFPMMYALYMKLVTVNGNTMPAFFAGEYPTVIGLERDVQKALKMIKYGNYGVDSLDELDAMDIPNETRDALRQEILGLSVGNEIKECREFIKTVKLVEKPKGTKEFSDLPNGVKIGRIGYNAYRFVYKSDQIDVNVTLEPEEKFRGPVQYKHLKFPVANFGIWHTGEYDGMDAYQSCAHTTIIHKYAPVLIDYPSNVTDIINHNGLSKQSVNTVVATHNHDDHNGAIVELFRRTEPCHVITTEPVKYSLIKKMSTLVDLPENTISESFNWTILPFRKDEPFETEPYNLDGLNITGHLSCHSVPTTLYTFKINHDGYDFRYGHFLDIVAFKRMKTMVKDGWMPKRHLEYLDKTIRKTKYSLIKYDTGCANDAAIPFTVHGQWQDLANSATEKSFRVFTHVNKDQLSEEYEKEGRFVEVGDFDAAVRGDDGRLVRFGKGLDPAISFFSRAYQAVLAYFKSLTGDIVDDEWGRLARHYAYAFANTPKQIDQNIGSFLIEQGEQSDYVFVIIRGRAEIRMFNKRGTLISRSYVGDGEVIGDLGVLSGHARMASVQNLNRLSYLAIPASLFNEAMSALKISYEGLFKQIFERRLMFQAADTAASDVSTIVLNDIGRNSETIEVKKDEKLIEEGSIDRWLYIIPGSAQIAVNGKKKKITGPEMVGEREFFLWNEKKNVKRVHSVIAMSDMTVLRMRADSVRKVPVIADNIRRLIRDRAEIYQL